MILFHSGFRNRNQCNNALCFCQPLPHPSPINVRSNTESMIPNPAEVLTRLDLTAHFSAVKNQADAPESYFITWFFYCGSGTAFSYLNSPVQNCLLRDNKNLFKFRKAGNNRNASLKPGLSSTTVFSNSFSWRGLQSCEIFTGNFLPSSEPRRQTVLSSSAPHSGKKKTNKQTV